ncbi:MAG: Uma2 family endonuclease [Desulfitobacteriaceae bacterium]
MKDEISIKKLQHQAISRGLLTQFNNYLKDKPCQVFAAPFDLRLPETNEKDEETTFVVQPDILVICEKAGVKEYWIVESDGKFISVFTLLPNNRYGRSESYTETEVVEVSVFPDFTVDLKPIFDKI